MGKIHKYFFGPKSEPLAHIIIIILGFIIYITTFAAPFVLDDEKNIKNNPALRDMRYFTSSSLQDKSLINKEIDEHFRSRIIGHLTFAFNYKLHGLKITGYHVVNLAIHILNSLLVYWLVMLTLKTPYFKAHSDDKSRGVNHEPRAMNHDLQTFTALFAGLFFVSHPIQTEAVTYITQRFTSLAAMFCLLSVVLYIKWRLMAGQQNSRAAEQQEIKKKYGFTALLLYCSSLLAAVLAMKTKEISFTLPVVIALHEFMFFEGKAKKRLIYLLPLLLTMLIVPVTVLGDRDVLTDIKRLEASVQGAPGPNDALLYLLTQFRVIVTYLRLLVLPVNQNLDYDYPLYHSFFDPNVFLSFLFLAGILSGGVYLLYVSSKKARGSWLIAHSKDGQRTMNHGLRASAYMRLISFGIFWFFITLSVDSSIIPLADVIFEHRLYLPSAGFFIVVVSAATIGKSRLGKTGDKAMTLLLALAILALSAATFQRNRLWSNDIILGENVVKKSPNKSRPHNNLGFAYEKQGFIDKAINEYLIALKIDPNLADTRVNLGVAYGKQGLADKAINEYQAALTLNPDYSAVAHYNLGIAYEKQGHIEKATNEYLTALMIKPDFADAHNNLGTVYEKQGNIDKAINEYMAALKINPDIVEAYNNLGIAYGKQGRTDKAINEFASALKINPDSAEAHNNLGIAYGTQGNIDKAISEFTSALKINPGYAEAHNNLGIAYEKQGNIDKAIAEYLAALKINPDYVDAHNNLGIAYANTGRTNEAAKEFKEALRLNPQDINARKNLEILRRK